jgi:hypothetical protein
MPLAPGDRVPDFAVLEGHAEPVTAEEIFAQGPTVVLFHVFDWGGDETEG